ncbi:MAG: SulP family inorganic anion transporter [Acidimicrobiales bacterium]
MELRADTVAGMTTAAVVVPQAMAYATIAGLPVQIGLYAGLVPMALYAVLGTSRVLSVSTTSTVAALTATALVAAGAQGDPAQATRAAITLALLTGAILAVAGVLRLGFLADLISVPVLVGFKVGTGLVIAAGQLGKILGIDASGENFFQQVGAALRHIGDVDPPTATLAGATISGLVVVHKVAPRVPGPLLAVGLGIAAVWAFDLGNDGVALIAPVPQGLPRPELPALDGSAALLAPAAAIALMAFVESSSAARSFRRPTDPPVVVDRELVALSAANMAGSAFGSMPAAGGLSQTAVNEGAGARSQTASLVTVAGVALTLTVLAPVFSDLAQATLGAVVIVAAAGLVDVGALRRLAAVRREELLIAALAALGVLLWGTVAGVVIGVALSYMLLFRILGRPAISVQAEPEGPWVPLGGSPVDARRGIMVVRVELPVYWASGRPVAERLLAAVDALSGPPRVLLLDWSNQPRHGSTLFAIHADLNEQLRQRGVALWVAGDLAAVQARPGGNDGIRHFASLSEALAGYGTPDGSSGHDGAGA